MSNESILIIFLAVILILILVIIHYCCIVLSIIILLSNKCNSILYMLTFHTHSNKPTFKLWRNVINNIILEIFTIPFCSKVCIQIKINIIRFIPTKELLIRQIQLHNTPQLCRKLLLTPIISLFISVYV